MLTKRPRCELTGFSDTVCRELVMCGRQDTSDMLDILFM